MLLKELPVSIPGGHGARLRTQYAALCYRVREGRPMLLMTTSRGTGRWITPKGWPIHGLSPAQTAAQEAWEEAGVIGKAVDRCLGLYRSEKVIDGKRKVPCVVLVYPVKVCKLARRYPERGERKRKWLSPRKAAARVCNPELAEILGSFDHKALR
jgi:8-oxo-dGTP pyrophosphatase MutT (NUDIX family)